MIVKCNKCNTKYKINDAKIPPKGAILRCRKCGNRIKVFPVVKKEEKVISETKIDVAQHERAKRYARVLASDAYLYNEKKISNAKAMNSLFDDLQDEVIKSYELYKKRVKDAAILRYNYFFDAFNKQLADGENVFNKSNIGA